MTASELLNNLRSRGVNVWVEAGAIRMSPASALTEDDKTAVLKVKPELLLLLLLPPRGSINRPMGVHARKLVRCPWDGCHGNVTGRQVNNLYLCVKCGWFFELLPPMEVLSAIN